MKYGTACNRLRKSLLFRCVQELGKDCCFRCKGKIEKIEEFTIEHKKSWILSPEPLFAFFHPENIAFSHSYCNYSCTTNRNQKRGKYKPRKK